MLTSNEIDKLAPALTAAQAELEHASKTKTNPAFRSKYADLAGVVDTIKPVFERHGLAVIQGNVPCDEGVIIQTRIVHSSGQWIEDEGIKLPLDKKTAQGVGSGVTYGRRYTLASMTGLATDDDDGNAASATPAKSTAKAPERASKSSNVQGKNMHPAAALVDEAQAAELTAAAVATGVDPALAERKAKNTKAVDFASALKKLKDKAASA